MSRPSPVRVVGMGAHTCVGTTALATAMVARARLLEPTVVGRDAGGDDVLGLVAVGVGEGARGLDRYGELCRPALVEAAANAVSPPKVVLCLPAAGRGGAPTESESVILAKLAEGSGIGIDPQGSVVLREGRAGWVRAAAVASELARAGHDVLLGGADVLVDPRTIDWLASRELTMSEDRSGLIPSEAAAFILLGPDKGRQTFGGIDMVRGVDSSGGERTVAEVLRSVALSGPLWLLSDANGEEARAVRWAEVEIALAPAELSFRDDVGQLVGEVGAAAGALLSAIALAWMRAGCAPTERCCVGLLDDDGSWSVSLVQA